MIEDRNDPKAIYEKLIPALLPSEQAALASMIFGNFLFEHCRKSEQDKFFKEFRSGVDMHIRALVVKELGDMPDDFCLGTIKTKDPKCGA